MNQTPSPKPAVPEARFVSLSSLLLPGGAISTTLFPTPSRRWLLRSLRSAGVSRWKNSPDDSPGRAEVYFDRVEAEAWIKSKVIGGAGSRSQ